MKTKRKTMQVAIDRVMHAKIKKIAKKRNRTVGKQVNYFLAAAILEERE